MNSHLNKEIFSETGCINKEILMQYHNGKLRDSEKHRVEKHLVDCNLCSEALEGFALLTGQASFDEVNEKLQQLTSQSGSAGYANYFAVAASIAVVISLTYFAYKQFEDVNTERLAVSEPVVVNIDTTAPVTVNEIPAPVQQLQTHTNSVNEINNRIVKPAEVQSEAAAASEASGVLSDNVVESGAADIVAAAPSINEKKLEEETVEPVQFNGAMPAASSGYATNVTYVDNRKVIDYSALSVKESTTAKDVKSVPGKYENQKQQSKAEADEQLLGITAKRNVNYLQLLEHPIALYNSAKYDAAVKEFDEILAIHPSDENARFYKGMSLYYLKKYEQAINLLKPLSNINTRPFSEEALFYTGKSYAALENKNEAISVFRTIVAKKGFYAERAKAELKRLE